METMKTFMDRLLSSTAALALGVTSLAASLVPGSANANVVLTPGANSPEDAPYVGPLGIGDEISQFAVSLPEYWEFQWAGPATTADISSSGSFFGSDSYADLELYSVTPASTTPPLTVDETNSASFQVTGTSFIGSIGFVSADLGDVSLTPGDDYVVGISGGEDPSFAINFNGVPEPASLPLLGGALAAFGFLRRRRKQRG